MTSNKLSRGSLQEKNGIWQAVFSKEGKTIWRSTGVKAVRGNKKKAQARLDEIRKELEDKVPEADTLFTDYIKMWFDIHKKNIREATYATYESHIETNILPYFEKLSLTISSVKVFHIDNFMQEMSKKLSRSSIIREKGILNMVFKDAIRNQVINFNPCEYAVIPKAKAPEQVYVYDVNEIKNIINLAKGKPIRDMIIMTFIYGLRREELFGLRWKDVDIENGVINIRNTVTVVGNLKIDAERTKTKKSKRQYPITPEIKEVLDRQKIYQEIHKALLGTRYKNGDKIFLKADGSEYHPDYPRQAFRVLLKKNKMTLTTWHSIRHSCASYLNSIGWNPKDIAEWLGHSNISTTMNIYTTVNIQQKKELSHQIEGILD